MERPVGPAEFRGTCSASIRENAYLRDALEDEGLDRYRYEPVGARFATGPGYAFRGRIVALDRERSSPDEPVYVEVELDGDIWDLFGLFGTIEGEWTNRRLVEGEVHVRDVIDPNAE